MTLRARPFGAATTSPAARSRGGGAGGSCEESTASAGWAIGNVGGDGSAGRAVAAGGSACGGALQSSSSHHSSRCGFSCMLARVPEIRRCRERRYRRPGPNSQYTRRAPAVRLCDELRVAPPERYEHLFATGAIPEYSFARRRTGRSNSCGDQWRCSHPGTPPPGRLARPAPKNFLTRLTNPGRTCVATRTPFGGCAASWRSSTGVIAR